MTTPRMSVTRVGRRGPSGEYGLPTLCHCGSPAVLKTSMTAANPGRLFFTCRVKEREMSLDDILKEQLECKAGSRHVWKWWDEAVMEELDIVRVEMQEAEDTYEVLLRRIGAGITAVNDPSGRIFSGEVHDMRELIGCNKEEIAKLKKEMNKRGSGYAYQLTFAFLAGMTLSAAVAYMFK